MVDKKFWMATKMNSVEQNILRLCLSSPIFYKTTLAYFDTPKTGLKMTPKIHESRSGHFFLWFYHRLQD